jgi:excisionase family DNA binding protein
MRQPMANFLNFKELAIELGIPLRTIYHLNKKGLGPDCHKVGRTFLVSREDLDIWLESSKPK